jgi:hypothetical protein
MSAFGIDKLSQHTAEILLLGRHAEQHALGGHFLVKGFDIRISETQFDLPAGFLSDAG